MADTDAAKVDANAKADAPDASDCSKIDNLKIDVKRGIGKPCTVAIALSQSVSLRQQALHESHSYGEGAYTLKFDATIEAKKEAKKEAKNRQQKPM